jgi:hypothetical protein
MRGAPKIIGVDLNPNKEEVGKYLCPLKCSMMFF